MGRGWQPANVLPSSIVEGGEDQKAGRTMLWPEDAVRAVVVRLARVGARRTLGRRETRDAP